MACTNRCGWAINSSCICPLTFLFTNIHTYNFQASKWLVWMDPLRAIFNSLLYESDDSRKVTQGWFTVWTTKSDQGAIRALIGCWTHPNTTFVYSKEKMAKGPQRLRFPKYNFQGLINALTWSNRFWCERGKGGGLVGKSKGARQRNAVIMNFSWGALYTTLPTRQGPQWHTFQHLYDVTNLQKQVHPLCALIIS